MPASLLPLKYPSTNAVSPTTHRLVIVCLRSTKFASSFSSVLEERSAPGQIRVDKAHLRIHHDGIRVDQHVVHVKVLLGIGAEPLPDDGLDFAPFVGGLFSGLSEP